MKKIDSLFFAEAPGTTTKKPTRFGSGHCATRVLPAACRESPRGGITEHVFPVPGDGPRAERGPGPGRVEAPSLLLAAAADVVGPSLARGCFPSRASARGAHAGGLVPPRAADARGGLQVPRPGHAVPPAARAGDARSGGRVRRNRSRDARSGRISGDESGEDEIGVLHDEIIRTSEKQTSAIRVVSVSSYGTVRSRTYASAEALADAIVEAADPSALGALRRRRPSRGNNCSKRGRRGSARSASSDERVYDRIKHGDVCFRERRHTRHTRNTRRAVSRTTRG